MVTLPLNNGVTETWTLGTYQKQPTALVASKNGSPLLNLGWSYGPDASNNGNVMGATIGSTYTQSFTYDPLNRLKAASETGGSGWQQTYVYDGYGNRAVLGGGYTPGNNWTPQVITDTPSAAAALFTGNRWYGAGVQYDNGAQNGPGNTTALPGTSVPWSFAYDAENRQTSATSPLGAATSYSYDGDGRRVQKTSGGVTTTYVYDAAGQLAAEYVNGTPPAEPCTTCYLTTDQLGSTRMVTDSAGNLVSLHDYLPFGEETPHSGAGYGAVDGVTQKFTGKERDVETGLDFFEARYFSSAQGRFTSPDEFKGGIVDPFTGQDIETNTALPYADITDPQTLNKYAYVRNNPLRYTDPHGHCFWDLCIGEGVAVYVAGTAAVAGAAYLMTPQGKESARAAIEGTGLLIGKAADGIQSVGSFFSKDADAGRIVSGAAGAMSAAERVIAKAQAGIAAGLYKDPADVQKHIDDQKKGVQATQGLVKQLDTAKGKARDAIKDAIKKATEALKGHNKDIEQKPKAKAD